MWNLLGVFITRVVQPVACGRYAALGSVMLPAEAFELGKRHLTLSLIKSGWNVEAFLKIYDLLAYGVILYVNRFIL